VILISTKLFSLQPVGLNTELVESQTSYISRLADAHCVSVGTLIGKELTPLLGREYIKNNAENGGGRLYSYAVEINGLGKQAADFANILSELTGVERIRDLTLMSWGGVFPVKNLFRKSKAWCPICFESGKKSGKPIYEPLIWNLKAVNICRIHSVRLETQCPNCKRELPFLSRKTRNGFCSFCGCWLGSDNDNSNRINEDVLSWENFVVKNIGSLIMMGCEFPVRLTDERICTFIKSVVDKVGGFDAFSKHVNIPVSTTRLWIRRINKPLLDSLLKICYRVGINITEIINPEQSCFGFVPIAEKPNPVLVEKSTDKSVKRRKIDWPGIENTLKNIIHNNAIFTPSTCEVARSLGLNKRLLYSHFPALCQTISKNHASYMQAMKQKRIDEGRQKISETITILHNSGIYPSRRQVEGVLSQKILLREKDYKAAWKEALYELGLL
jgi:hypothetical protein